MGLIGGIAGMLAGSFAPEVITGFYALDGPDPPPTFNPVAWGSRQGLLTGLVLGAGGGLLVFLCLRFASWRPRMTMGRLMLLVAAVAVGMGLARWCLAIGLVSPFVVIAIPILARIPRMSPGQRVVAVAILAVAVPVCWLLVLIVRDAQEKAQDERWMAWPIPSEEEYRRSLDGAAPEPQGLRPCWWPFGS